MENTNWLALIVATLIPMLLGFVWYGKIGFGKAWMKQMGFTEADANTGNMGVIFGVSIVMSFLSAVFVNINVAHGVPDHSTFGHGFFHGAIIGVFVAMPIMVTNALFERKGVVYMLLNVGYWILNFALMGGVLAAWTK